ncbi:MAG: CDP-alcohol phosphatidyltransferase family protein [Propionibacteriaceae bacterium]|nr:CDP-alcohol phosphatidyltransferase family protein [Propionibacteriaceae bacterium]
MDIKNDPTHFMETRSYCAALRRLQSAQKPAAGTPLYSRLVNRPLGRRLAALSYLGGLTPNQVTCISAVFTFSAFVIIASLPPTWWMGVLVSALLVFGYALDAADGQLARLRGGGSAQGEWLDHTVDVAKAVGLHLAILITAYRHFELSVVWLLVPIAYAVVDSVMFSSMLLKDLLAARQLGGKAPVSSASTSLVRAIMVIPTDYGFFCLTFVLLGQPLLFFSVYVFLFACNAIILVLVLRKWFRDMGSLPS